MAQATFEEAGISAPDLLDAIEEYQREFVDAAPAIRTRRQAEAYLARSYERYRSLVEDGARLLADEAYLVELDGQLQQPDDFDWVPTPVYVRNTLALFQALAPFEREFDADFPVLARRGGAMRGKARGAGEALNVASVGRIVITLLSCGLSLLGGGPGTKWEALSRRLARFLKSKPDVRAMLDAIRKAAQRGEKSKLPGLLASLLDIIWGYRDEIQRIVQRAVGRRFAIKMCARLGARLIPFVGWILFAISLVTNILGMVGLGGLLGDDGGGDEDSGEDETGGEGEEGEEGEEGDVGVDEEDLGD